LWQNQRFLPIFDVTKKYNYLILKGFIYAPTPFEVEKQQLLNAEKEIALLKRIIELTEAKVIAV
jgi:hypothetical protein